MKGVLIFVYIVVMLAVSGWDIYLVQLAKKVEFTDYSNYSNKFETGRSDWPKNNLADWTTTCYSQFKNPYGYFEIETIPKDAWSDICRWAEQQGVAPIEINQSARKIGCVSSELKYTTCNQANLMEQIKKDLPEIKQKENEYKEVYEKLSKLKFFHVVVASMWGLFVFGLIIKGAITLDKKMSNVKTGPIVEAGLGILGELMKEKLREAEKELAKEEEKKAKSKNIEDLQHDIKITELRKTKAKLEKELSQYEQSPETPIKKREREQQQEIENMISIIQHEVAKGQTLDDLYDKQVGQIYVKYGNDEERLKLELTRLKSVINQIKFGTRKTGA